MAATKIEWATTSWNPVTGCTPISPGCANCYAKRMANRLRGRYGYDKDEPFKVTLHRDKLNQPVRWKKPRRIFVCSMGDLFIYGPGVWIESTGDPPFGFVYRSMVQAPQHIYLLLTKRPDIMAQFFYSTCTFFCKPVPANWWIGASVENGDCQWRIRQLEQIPAAIHFVSFEPVLEEMVVQTRGIDWAIIGCESGPRRRPCHLQWVRSLVYQFKSEDKPVFVKQIEINGKVSHNMDEWPEELRIREYPNGEAL